MTPRYAATDLTGWAIRLLGGVGLDAAMAQCVAEVLVEGDLLGHTTHGLALLAPYLGELERGAMAKTGTPRVLADFPAAVTWDGGRLPGPWLVVRALDLAMERATVQGTCTVVIRRSHHIACLASYLRRITERGFVGLLTCSDPAAQGVAPHGGCRSVFTPNPIAAAWPTDGDPVVLDLSASITTNGMVNRLRAEGGKFPAPWLVDGHGQPSDDPAVVFADPPGAILPAGGLDHGHKGYALGLLVETLTGGLAGHGRADEAEGWSANVFVQVFAPTLFGGAEAFVRQTSFVAEACRATPPRAGFDRVRLPGERGLARRAAQLAAGVELYAGVMPALAPWAAKLGVAPPAPVA